MQAARLLPSVLQTWAPGRPSVQVQATDAPGTQSKPAVPPVPPPVPPRPPVPPGPEPQLDATSNANAQVPAYLTIGNSYWCGGSATASIARELVCPALGTSRHLGEGRRDRSPGPFAMRRGSYSAGCAPV